MINDRPVVGGNNSSEIRVHLGGRIEEGTYKELGGLQKEFGPEKGGNAQPAEYYEDQKKMDWLAGEKNVSLFPELSRDRSDKGKAIRSHRLLSNISKW